MTGIIEIVQQYKKLVAGILATLILGGGFYYYRYQSRKNVSLETSIATLKAAVDAQNEAILDLQDSSTKQAEATLEMSKAIEDAKKAVADVHVSVYREEQGKKSIETLAQKKPRLVEKAINNGAKKIVDDLNRTSEENYAK